MKPQGYAGGRNSGQYRATRRPSFTIALIALCICLLGQKLAQDEREDYRQRAEQNLLDVATLKAWQFAEWRRERIADAQTLADNPFLAREVAELLAEAPDAASVADDLRRHLRSLQENYRYEDILILDARGRTRFSLTGQDGTQHLPLNTLLAASSIGGHSELSDFHPVPGSDDLRLLSIAPLSNGSDETTRHADAYIVLQSSLEKSLLPLLTEPALANDRGANFIVRHEGEHLHLLGKPGRSASERLQHRLPLQGSELRTILNSAAARTLRTEDAPLTGGPALVAIAAPLGSEWRIISIGRITDGEREGELPLFALMATMALLLAAALSFAYERRQCRPSAMDEADGAGLLPNEDLLPAAEATRTPPPPAPPGSMPPPPLPPHSAAPAASPLPPHAASPSITPPAAPPPALSASAFMLEDQGLSPLTAAGIDVQAGLRVVAGREKRYLELLGKYLEHHRDLATEIATSWQAGDASAARKLAHTLKGAAGTLGLQTAHLAASMLEQALRSEGKQAVPALIAELERTHREQCAAVEQFLQQNADRIDPETTSDAPAAALEQLEALLAEDDIRSNECARRLRAPLSALLEADHEHFCRLIDRFDYPAALKLLRPALRRDAATKPDETS